MHEAAATPRAGRLQGQQAVQCRPQCSRQAAACGRAPTLGLISQANQPPIAGSTRQMPTAQAIKVRQPTDCSSSKTHISSLGLACRLASSKCLPACMCMTR